MLFELAVPGFGINLRAGGYELYLVCPAFVKSKFCIQLFCVWFWA
jgi:hypothetical protein